MVPSTKLAKESLKPFHMNEMSSALISISISKPALDAVYRYSY